MVVDRATIVACCTAVGGSGGSLALIRVSGPDAHAIVSARAHCSHGKPLKDQLSHTVHHGFIKDQQGMTLDEVLFIIMHGPRTFTGEDTVEITCHNNLLIVEAICRELIAAGARQAQRGEFSEQAFLNNKMDLAQAEAIHDLIHATTEAGLRASLAQLSGTLSHHMATIEQQLLKLTAWCEVTFEFVDEMGDFRQTIQDQLGVIVGAVTAVERSFSSQVQIKEGMRIALVGSVNAGKSSLFNRLLGRERSIVTPVAGTTRDTIEGTVARRGVAWTFIDTAGLRMTDDPIEREGILRSWREAQTADLILLVVDSTRPLTSEESARYGELCQEHGDKIIIVEHKADNHSYAFDPKQHKLASLPVSSLTLQGLAELEALMHTKIGALFAEQGVPFLINQRHQRVLREVTEILQQVVDAVHVAEPAYELISAQLQTAVALIGEVTGKTVGEGALDRIFREFCIGK